MKAWRTHLTLTDFLNGFGKVCLLMMLLMSYIMFMVCYVMVLAVLRYSKTIDYIRDHPDILAKLTVDVDLKNLKPHSVRQLVIQALAGIEDDKSMQFAISDIVYETNTSYFLFQKVRIK